MHEEQKRDTDRIRGVCARRKAVQSK